MTDFSPLTYDPDAPDPATAVLLTKLADPDAAIRRVALLELADLEDENLLAHLAATLRRDPSPEVRTEAARVLGAWPLAPVVEMLCAALADPAQTVREAAAQSLSEPKHEACGPVLLRWLEHPEPFVRAAVLFALRELRYPPAFAPALQSLGDSHSAVRCAATGVLGWLKDARALPTLARLASADPDPNTRRAAIGALGLGNASDSTVVDALLIALRDDAWQVREEAAATLGKLRAAAGGVSLLAALTDDTYWQVRLQAARTLGKLRDPASVPALATLLGHPISNLRKEAALALGEIGEPGALGALQAAARDRDPEVRKAVRIALAQLDGAAP